MGHVGDGNFHSLLFYTTDDELAVIKSLASNLAVYVCTVQFSYCA